MRLLLILLLIPVISISQPLASIKTKSQAENFIKSNFKYYTYRYDSFKIASLDSIAIDKIKYPVDNFKIGDFNHDGLNDLLVFANIEVTRNKHSFREYEIVIIIGDKNKPRKVKFPNDFFGGFSKATSPFPRAITLDGKDFVLIKYGVRHHFVKKIEPMVDTVFVKDDKLIPFNRNPSSKKIQRIEFKTNQCFGSCPVFELTINSNKEVLYNGIEFVDKKGKFNLSINEKDWNFLTTLIAYNRLEDLEDNYAVEWTDSQTAYLKVFYEDGQIKSITDYGLSGTFGLSMLYDFLFELRKF